MGYSEQFNELMKSINETNKLNYFKTELLKILDAKEKQENRLSKSIQDYFDSIHKTFYGIGLEKGRVGTVGEIRTWKDGKKYKKMPDGKWVRVYQQQNRSAEISIARLKGKVRNAQSVDELMNIVMGNIHRFEDENGQILPIVEELKKEVHDIKVIKSKGSKEKRDFFEADIPETIKNSKFTEPYLEYLGTHRPVNLNVEMLYKNINKLFKYRDNKYNDGEGSFFCVKGIDGLFTPSNYSPKITVPDFNGETSVTTFIHEMGHAIDFFISNTRSFADEDTELDNFLRGKLLKEIPKNILIYLKSNDYQGIKYKNEYKEKYKEWEKLFLANKKGTEEYDVVYKELREISRKFIENENSYKYSSLCDIMDALSGGKFWDSFNPKNDNDINALPIGHGSGKDFFSSITNRKMEIFADYLAMNYVSPESVTVLKKDFPELVKILDKIIDKIVLKIKEF